MEKKDMQQGKAIGNVGILDLRKATEESIAGIRMIGNVGTLFFSRETAALIPRLIMGNIGNTVEVPANAKLITGEEVFSRDYFKNQSSPLNLMVIGVLTVNPDVPAEEIERGLSELRISGEILYPEHLAGVIASKIRELSGNSLIYTPSSRIVRGTLILDQNYLRALDNASDLLVFGTLKLPQVLPAELLEQKVGKLQVFGKITCHEENVQTIYTRLDKKTGSAKMTTIPAGFELVEHPLILDADLLEALPSRRLYCTDRIQIDLNVDPAVLDRHLESIVIEDTLICPASLKGVISRKFSKLKTQAIFYQGELWLIEDDFTLLASRFNYLEGKATLAVFGDLKIAPEVDPKLLFERLDQVHNFGDIICTPEQMSAIQARLGINEGDLVDSTKLQTDEDEDEDIGNIGHLIL